MEEGMDCKRELESQRFEDAALLALKMEEGALSKGT